MKAFVIDVNKCNGCRSCQVGCKDEHCGNDWLPIAKAQPMIGQFWMDVAETERGARPHVRVSYIPQMGAQNSRIKEYAPEVLLPREDGLVVIDPEKAVGRRDLAEKFDGVFWNEELNIPQGCTGCAHLIDDPDSPIRVPRCVDNCAVGAIAFGEVEELDLEGAVPIDPEDANPIVFYKNMPKKFIAATVFDPEADEVVEGAKVVVAGNAGTYETETNNWGDFWLNDLPDADWALTIEKDGKSIEMQVSTIEKDQGLPDIALA